MISLLAAQDGQRAALIFKHAGRDLRGVATHLYERVVEPTEEKAAPAVKTAKRKAKRPARKAPARARKTAAAPAAA